jgi:hypothetical protein
MIHLLLLMIFSLNLFILGLIQAIIKFSKRQSGIPGALSTLKVTFGNRRYLAWAKLKVFRPMNFQITESYWMVHQELIPIDIRQIRKESNQLISFSLVSVP